ncbi:MAG TPA: hypothetical protein VFD59_19270 [Nocardioidaceae bacterium]|nr:hypothetical protein [Nocardioidaceae bacterium]
MSDNPFDPAAIRGSMDASSHSNEECIAFCRSALEHFNSTAKQVGTPLVEVETSSMAARAAGIAMGSWPTAGGKATYYRILTNGSFDHVWTAADGRGLTQTEDGQFYFEGSAAGVDGIAASVARLAGYDATQAKQIFEAALRGEALSYG